MTEVTADTYKLCHKALRVYPVVKYLAKLAKVKLARANSPPLKKLSFKMVARGKSMKKPSKRAMPKVTPGTTMLSIFNRMAGTG